MGETAALSVRPRRTLSRAVIARAMELYAERFADPDGKVREVRMQAVSSLTDFSFDFQDLLLLPVGQ